jgi:TAG lipase/steryl ester hydrolase/phospholipase A2/LPA acyltransferase
LTDLGIKGSLLYRVKAILVQKYYGDITIVPSLAVKDYAEIVTNPDDDMYAYYMSVGEKATWPRKYSMVAQRPTICAYGV